MTIPLLTAQQRRVLQLLSKAEPHGITETLWADHELSGELPFGPRYDRARRHGGDTERDGDSTIKVVRLRITDAGQRAIDE